MACTNVLHNQIDCPSSELPPSEWCEFCTKREAEDVRTIAEEKGMTEDEFNDWAESWRTQADKFVDGIHDSTNRYQ